MVAEAHRHDHERADPEEVLRKPWHARVHFGVLDEDGVAQYRGLADDALSQFDGLVADEAFEADGCVVGEVQGLDIHLEGWGEDAGDGPRLEQAGLGVQQMDRPRAGFTGADRVMQDAREQDFHLDRFRVREHFAHVVDKPDGGLLFL